MIKTLSVTNLDPIKNLDISFGSRLNLITGDNGLGKTFLLDLIWYVMTRQWPAEVNPQLTGGYAARPVDHSSSIGARIQGQRTADIARSSYSVESDRWIFEKASNVASGMVFYLMSDGSFALWDAERRCCGKRIDESPPALVLTQKQVFNGLAGESDAKLCNGLIADWAVWSDSIRYAKLAEETNHVLKTLSPSGEAYSVGLPVRVGINDVRRVPTIKMPYGTDVPIIMASSAVKRIAELAYMLVWFVNEHAEIVGLKDKGLSRRVTLLIDEAESHLHPRWQRSIVPALLDAVEVLYKHRGSSVSTQVILPTRSPLIRSSVSARFDAEQDKWLDLILNNGQVSLTDRQYPGSNDIEW